MSNVLIVVPCYNEAGRLDVESFLAFACQKHAIRFLFVNDGSKDETLEVLTAMRDRAPDRIDLLDLEKNGGKAEAVRRGFLAGISKSSEPNVQIHSDSIGFWDADLATPLEEIPTFSDILEAQPDLDMVFGSRVQLLGRTIERKIHRHYFGRILATAVSQTLDMPIYDSQCGAKLFRVTKELENAISEPFFSGWVFDVELIARLKRLYAVKGLNVADRIHEQPLRAWRDVHGSKTRASDAFVALVNLARIYRTYLRD